MTLPCLFAGKMHAVLCRRWRSRVKGRDWYDLVWYVANATPLHLKHLERRMQQSGHWPADRILTESLFQELLAAKIEDLDVKQARLDVEPFVKDVGSLAVWSREFFHEVGSRVVVE